MSSLDDIAWLLNLRGNDIPCNPVFLSYVMVAAESVTLFADPKAFGPELAERLAADHVSIKDYDQFYASLKGIRPGTTVLLDKGRVNSLVTDSLSQGVHVLDEEDPILLPKAMKNPVEALNVRNAHIKDGAAVTKFIYWMKQNAGRIPITEMSAAEKLFELRSRQDGFLGNSFDPIIAYKEHAAIIHYSATRETDAAIYPVGMVLADTGGQYLEGTTDITRTFSVGETTMEEKIYFTAVLLGHIRLAEVKFPEGTAGCDLDVLAREPLWEMEADYNHGTGHGVGYLLNVHEGPQRIHYKGGHHTTIPASFAEGMITSDEPGYYAPGKFGIRHENLMICQKKEKNGYLFFEPLTLVPFDRELILPERLPGRERDWLNAYHQKVYEKIHSFLSSEEERWLYEATREL